MIIVFVVGGGLLLFFAFLVNLRWKISIHMLGIGGLMGMAFGFAWIFQLHMVNVLMLMAVLAGALGTARLILKAHSPAQVYTGFMSGFMIESGYFFMVFHNVHTH